MDLEAILANHAANVDARLALHLPPLNKEPRELHEAMRYAVLAPGKRLRPALVLECAALFGSTEAALDPACAVELVHAFSLIHDDLPALDNDDLRRGRPTCHVQFGEAVAILAGDALFALAFEVLARCPVDPTISVQALRELAGSSGWKGLAGGEARDILSEGRPLDAETLYDIHRRKTGALITCSCVLGGLFGGADVSELELLRTFGSHLGMAFQIADDILNESSSAEQLGKSAGSDRERGKLTYVSVHGMEEARRVAKQEVASALEYLNELKKDAAVLRNLAQFSIERTK